MRNIAKKISEAIKSKGKNGLLQFGDFKILKILGKGQQGIVVLVQNPNKKRFAIKLFSPADKDPEIVQASKERFIRETKILLELKHRNIVDFYAGGSAEWNDSNKKWSVSYNLARFNVLYYVMEYVEGKSVKNLFFKGFIKKTLQYVTDPTKATPSSLNLFEELVLQMSDAMAYFHSRGIVHRDIKPDNIIYSADDNNFVIVDFGFAKHFKTRTDESFRATIPKKPYLDFESYRKGKVDHLSDQYSFAKMSLQILRIFRRMYAGRNLTGLLLSLRKAIAKRVARYKNMRDFKTAIEPYLYSCPHRNYNFQQNTFLIPLIRFGYFNYKIRVPFSGSIPLFKEILDIIDTGEFQRLKGVRQLGPTHFVYPGALHTRFEHSLGTYFLSLKYLEVLLKIPEFYRSLSSVDESIKVIVLGSLLHDIGHYPYSHWIEEIQGLPDGIRFNKHEDRAGAVIMGGDIKKMIETKWQVDPNIVCRLIAGKPETSEEELMKSIIDSDIDVDKVDYLQRDSAHCGVPYGHAFDVDRLISSLWVNETGNCICLTEKGRSPFAALTMSNIVMYQEVYWHKTVRACTAMFKRFFYEFLSRKMVTLGTIEKYLRYPDEKFVEALYTSSKKNKELNRLILPFTNRGRMLYKPAYVHYPEHETYIKDGTTKDFFKLLTSHKNYPDQVRMSNLLASELRKHIETIRDLDVILETAPVGYREVPHLIGFKFYDLRRGKYENITSEIANLNQYLESNRSSYIFCNPKYYDDLRKLSKNGVLSKIMGKVYSAAN